MEKESLGKYIAAIYRNSQSIISKKFQDYGIGSGQHDFFYVISKNEGITQKELSNILNIGKATTAKAVKSLLEGGYIIREKNMEDKRFNRLYLTEKGKQIAPIINSTFKEMIEIYANGFLEEEYIHILNSLKKILNNVYNVKKRMEGDE